MIAGAVQRTRAALSPAEWRRAGLLTLAVIALHALGFALLLALVGGHHGGLGRGGGFGLGLGITAYTLGLRHAFDADHISAIDNATRKLVHEGQRPLSLGFFFSLGHSTIVLALAVLVVAGVRGIDGGPGHGSLALHDAGSVVGPAVSGAVLLAIGMLNLVILANVVGIFRRMRRGYYDEQELERQLAARGLANRFYGRAARAVRRPWHAYPLGALFGLGFDTATEVALLVLAGAGAASGISVWVVLCLPVLFAAGMSLFDTLDGAFMNMAYGWALCRPVRKVFYNIAITGLSVAVALLIGTIELLSVLAKPLGLSGGAWQVLTGLDLNLVGYVIVGLSLLIWGVALAVWRFGHLEERWAAGLRRT